MLILGGTLDMIFGRRYGFVGRNGLGNELLSHMRTAHSL